MTKMVRITIIVICFAFSAVGLCESGVPPNYYLPLPGAIVQTYYGPVQGSSNHSRNSRPYQSFRGIPYAKAPIGDLRFRAPQPPDSWNGKILDATKEGPYCIQKNYWFANEPKVEGQEDCLYLNVYVPTSNQQQLLPVMVFIHWGGFFAGRGTSDYLNPDYFMDKNVVLVTFNYRLGVMGFLSTLDDNAPGNFALKDQVQALRFVKENIENFRGDPDRVTIFGQSAGGGSVSLHLVSPLSRGLFQYAISQSGVALNLWAKPFNLIQCNITTAQAVFAGCSDHIQNSTTIINCLRKVDARTLVNSAEKFKHFGIEPLTPFTLVTETKTEANPEPFLVKEPLEYFQAGDFQKVPYIMGIVRDEGILRAAPLLRREQSRNELNWNFTKLLPQILVLAPSVGFSTDSLYQNISDFYLQGDDYVDINDPKKIQSFVDLYSDRGFNYGVYQSALVQSAKDHDSIWMYQFNYRGDLTYGDLFASTAEQIGFHWGVSHCDDLIYLFKSPSFLPELSQPTDYCMSVTMIELWTNFAITGNPDPAGSIGWRPINAGEVKVNQMEILNITGPDVRFDLKITRGFIPERIRFWQSQSILENFIV